MPTDDLAVSTQSSVLPSDLAHDPTPPGSVMHVMWSMYWMMLAVPEGVFVYHIFYYAPGHLFFQYGLPTRH